MGAFPKFRLVLIALLALAEALHAQSSAFFESARAAVVAERNKLIEAYAKDVGEMALMYQQAGDLNAKAAAEAELQRLRASEDIGARPAAPLPSGVEALKEDYFRRLREQTVRVLHPLIAARKAEIEQLKRDHDFATASQFERELEGTRMAFGIQSITISNAKLLFHPAPKYPAEAKRKRLSGKGLYSLDVDFITGKVTNVSVQQSAGDIILDDSAVAALRTWKFQPHTAIEVTLPITFSVATGKRQK